MQVSHHSPNALVRVYPIVESDGVTVAYYLMRTNNDMTADTHVRFDDSAALRDFACGLIALAAQEENRV